MRVPRDLLVDSRNLLKSKLDEKIEQLKASLNEEKSFFKVSDLSMYDSLLLSLLLAHHSSTDNATFSIKNINPSLFPPYFANEALQRLIDNQVITINFDAFHTKSIMINAQSMSEEQILRFDLTGCDFHINSSTRHYRDNAALWFNLNKHLSNVKTDEVSKKSFYELCSDISQSITMSYAREMIESFEGVTDYRFNTEDKEILMERVLNMLEEFPPNATIRLLFECLEHAIINNELPNSVPGLFEFQYKRVLRDDPFMTPFKRSETGGGNGLRFPCLEQTELEKTIDQFFIGKDTIFRHSLEELRDGIFLKGFYL